jgi:predicted MFS family arabinose efflux permease
VLSIGAAAGIGMARFAFGPVLPALRDDLGWSLTTGGAVQSANLGAYLVGSLMTPRIIRRYGLRRPYWYSYVAIGVTLLLTGIAGDVASQVALRLIAGGTAGVLLISGGIIAARLSTGATSGLIIGLFFGGVGAGIAAAGLLLPIAFASDGGRRIVWWVMGAATIVAAPFVFLSLRAACASIAALPEPPLLSSARPDGVAVLVRLEIAYILFGLGSIGYMTFVVALLRGQDASPGDVGAFWAVLGMASLVAGRLWASSINRSESGRLAGLMYLLMAGASMVVIVSSTLGALIFSAAAFGSVFVSAVSATTHLIRVQLPQERWTATLARFTVGYGVAMTIGSTAAGAMSDRFGLPTSIFISALVLLLAAVAAGLQPGVAAET